MTSTPVEFATSSNGDRWSLINTEAPMARHVIHTANLPSGGTETSIPLSDFLRVDIGSPQHSALTVLLSSLKMGPAMVSQAPYQSIETHCEPLPYEPGMQIIWDVLTREIVVIFRGSVTTMTQRFGTCQDGIDAGEELCRNSGWGQ